MGLLDFLDKEKRQQRKLESAIARLTNPYMQGPERMRGADTLLQIGSDEAIYGLLKRFTIRASNGVVDEEEKEQVYGMLVGLGAAAIPPIERFIRREDQTYQALRALSALLPEDEVVRIIGAALEELGPDYMRNPERKLHLIQHLAELRNPGVLPILLPFLDDFDENVRFQTINGLKEQADEAAREPLLTRLCGEEEQSLRLKKRIIEVIEELGWTVKGFRKQVEELLPKGHSLDKAGHIRSKGSTAATTELLDDESDD